MAALLEVAGLRKRYGAIVVADDVTFSLEPGQCLGIIAPNGAGKSSVFNLIAGVAPSFAFDPNWVVAMMFIVLIGGIGTLEGPILGSIIYFALREVATGVLALSGGWYLVVLGAAAMATMVFAPAGLWPVVRDRLGVDGLSVRRRPPARSREVAPVERRVSASA